MTAAAHAAEQGGVLYARSRVFPCVLAGKGISRETPGAVYGDAFLVYPGPDGEPLTSLRAEVQSEGLTDLRALQTLEAHAGREAVERLVLANAGMESMSYTQYPVSASYLLTLREAVFDALEKV